MTDRFDTHVGAGLAAVIPIVALTVTALFAFQRQQAASTHAATSYAAAASSTNRWISGAVALTCDRRD